ncbi:hypothetical protein MIND_00058700 [Mycena indigotica]|uniref:Tyr recombinase domain-containing protein n=1 Tax=Mycena indigotica TaxID=2126181 RepID=A0A8H6WHU1_9AGAR|nr:uncharacterized protein MIND_00058700 [Mycena indigotica]KAF7315438.1 hypothetical protein MIND_00058700 [Mycena indigotica]
MNGLAHWHHINFAPWFGKETSVKKVLRAVDKDNKFSRPPRGPVSITHMRAIRDSLDLASPRGAAFWALACAAFWGCRRLGELTLATKTFDPKHDASRSAPISRSTRAGREVLSIHLPWTKTTGCAGGTLILTATNDDLCPIRAFDNHTAVNHSPEHETPLFAFRDDSPRAPGPWLPVVKTAFLSFISSIFRAANLEQVFGHSFRIGGRLDIYLFPHILAEVGVRHPCGTFSGLGHKQEGFFVRGTG